jgi:hypothetical protein
VGRDTASSAPAKVIDRMATASTDRYYMGVLHRR